MAAAANAHLHGGPSRRPVRAAVLLLHGGREIGREVTAPQQLAVLRMLDLYGGLRRRSSTAAVYLLRYRLRGWNADPSQSAEPAPVTDTRWALDQIAARHGGVPVALLGHSMGGRTAFAVAGDSRVAGVCALAPWLPPGEPLPAARQGQRFVIAHGTADRTTSAAGSLDYARRLRGTGSAVARFELAGGGHALLQRPARWHRFAVSVTLGLVDDKELPSGVSSALLGADDDGLQLPMTAAFG